MKGMKLLLGLSLLAKVAHAVEPKILFEEDPTLLTSTIQVVITSGGQDDPPGKRGLTNLMGELMLRGTKQRSRTQFQAEIERMGATLGVHTSNDNTIFVGRVIKENTEAFFKLLSQALREPSFPKAEFEALKTEMLADISAVKNSNARLSGLAMRHAMMADTILDRPVEGSLSTIKSVTREDIIAAYQARMNRANFVFAVAAPLKEADLKKSLVDLWSAFPDGKRLTHPSIAPKVPAKPELVLVNKPKTSTGAIMLGQGGITAQDPARFALAVGNFAFGQEPLISRLFRIIRSELGWTYSIGSTYHAAGPSTFQQGFYVISSTPSVEFTSKTILKLLTMWKEYTKKGLTGDELKLAKESLVNSYPFEFDSAEKRLWQKLHSYLYDVPLLSPEEFGKTIGRIDNDDVTKALADRQASQGWVIAVVADQNVIEKQLAAEQADIPAAQRLTISKVVTPDDLIQ